MDFINITGSVNGASARTRRSSRAPARDGGGGGGVDGSCGSGSRAQQQLKRCRSVARVGDAMWRSLLVLATLAACLVTAARGRSRNRLLDGDDPLGSPGELAWQAWLLMDEASTSAGGGSGAEVGGARRITPKSVFIAPAFAPQTLPPCADGHKRDAAGRCVQVVHINRDAQLNFLLQRLNNLHARPAPGRMPLPLPARQQDLGPLRVRLRVPLPTAAAAPAPTEQPATVATTPAPVFSAAAPAQDGGADDSPSVSVVMADVSKRSSAEQSAGGSGADSNSNSGGADVMVHDEGGADDSNSNSTSTSGSTPESPKPALTVWTIQNNTLHKTQDIDPGGPSLSVELATTTTEATTGTKVALMTTVVPPMDVHVPLSDVLDPSEIEGALPMLVISPGTSAPLAPITTTTVPERDAALDDASDANRTTVPEGSGEPQDGNTNVTQLEDDVGSPGLVSSTERGYESDSGMKETEDDRETGSADVMEQIEVVPISENSRYNLPLVGEDHDQDTSFSQAGLASGLAGLFRPLPVDVLSSPTQDETPYGHPVRFPTDARDEPQRFHLFKGNYLKFQTEHAYRYKLRPVTDPPDVKQTFWWVPSGWRIEQQRHQPALQDFWPRMPASEDLSHFSQYNPSYHSPLPYQQRQAQYDPQWSSMKKQMTT